MKGTAALLGLESISQLSHGLENLLNQFREHVYVPTQATTDIMLRAADTLRDMVDDPASSNEIDVSELVEKLNSVGDKPRTRIKRRVLKEKTGSPKPANKEPNRVQDSVPQLTNQMRPRLTSCEMMLNRPKCTNQLSLRRRLKKKAPSRRPWEIDLVTRQAFECQ